MLQSVTLAVVESASIALDVTGPPNLQLLTTADVSMPVLAVLQVNTTYKKDPVAFAKSWLSAHMKSSEGLGKPFVVEEFGKNIYDRSPDNIAKVRDPVFAAVYDALADSLKSGGVFRGETACVWHAIATMSSRVLAHAW